MGNDGEDKTTEDRAAAVPASQLIRQLRYEVSLLLSIEERYLEVLLEEPNKVWQLRRHLEYQRETVERIERTIIFAAELKEAPNDAWRLGMKRAIQIAQSHGVTRGFIEALQKERDSTILLGVPPTVTEREDDGS